MTLSDLYEVLSNKLKAASNKELAELSQCFKWLASEDGLKHSVMNEMADRLQFIDEPKVHVTIATQQEAGVAGLTTGQSWTVEEKVLEPETCVSREVHCAKCQNPVQVITSVI